MPAPDAPGTGGGDEAAAAVAELRILVHRLSDEVAAFRRRAIAAEARLRALEARGAATGGSEAGAAAAPAGDAPPPADLEAVARLERENAELRARLGQAAERTRQLLERARFLRQQQGEGGA